MSANVRFWSSVGLLVIGVGAAVSSLGAQAAGEPRESAPRREATVLEGRGGRLGVMIRDLDPAEAGAPPAGVKIDSVDRESPAEKAGLKPGDVVVEYDGERVRSARQFSRLVQETPEGRAVPLGVMRDGKRQTLTATPEARAFAWNFKIDEEEVRREVERGLEGLREFRMGPPQRFRFDGGREGLFMPVPMGRSRLGVTVDSLTDQLAAYFGATEGGALVTSVRPDSPAEKAGLKAGDVVTSINGDRVRDAADLMDEVSRAAGAEITVGYLRERKPGTAKATIEPRTDGSRPSQEPRRPVRPAAFARPA